MPIVLEPPVVGFGGGYADRADLGSGVARPGGLENIIEYNGLVMNDTSTVDRIRVTEIGGLDDADVRDSREANPSYHGETAFDAWYGGRNITLTGRIEAHSLEKLRDMQMAIKQAFAPLEEKPLIFRSYNGRRDVFLYARKSASIAMREAQTDMRFFRDFLVTLRASDPRFLDYFRTFSRATIPNTLAPTVLRPVNMGNFNAQPTIRLIGRETNPVITNSTTGASVALIGEIPTGTYIDIDIKNRKVIDNTGANRFGMLDMNSDWLELVPGENVIEVTTQFRSTNSAVEIYFRSSWI